MIGERIRAAMTAGPLWPEHFFSLLSAGVSVQRGRLDAPFPIGELVAQGWRAWSDVMAQHGVPEESRLAWPDVPVLYGALEESRLAWPDVPVLYGALEESRLAWPDVPVLYGAPGWQVQPVAAAALVQIVASCCPACGPGAAASDLAPAGPVALPLHQF